MSYWCVFLATSLSTYHSNIGVQRRRVTTYGLHTLLPFTIPQCKCSSNEGENRLLVTYEPVELRNNRLKLKTIKRTTDHFRRIYIIFCDPIKKNPKDVNINRLDSATLGSHPIMPKNLPGCCVQLQRCCMLFGGNKFVCCKAQFSTLLLSCTLLPLYPFPKPGWDTSLCP